MPDDPLAVWTPSPGDVAEHLRARMRDRYGSAFDEFSDSTTPTAEQVAKVARQAATLVAPVIGVSIPEVTHETARNVVAIRAAAIIERTYFAEQVPTGRSPYDQLMAEYREELKLLDKAVERARAGDDIGEGSGEDVPPPAVASFPPVRVGWLP